MSEEQQRSVLTLVPDTGSFWTAWPDRQYPKGYRAVLRSDGWHVGMWYANFRKFDSFHTPKHPPYERLEHAEWAIEHFRKTEFRPVWPPVREPGCTRGS